MIIDTNAMSGWWLGTPGIVQEIRGADRLCVPVPVLAEFRFGIMKSRLRDRMESWLGEVLTTVEVLPADEVTTVWYALIRYDLEKIGRPIPMNDLWIAAIACQNRLRILSQDAHFDAVDRVERIGW